MTSPSIVVLVEDQDDALPKPLLQHPGITVVTASTDASATCAEVNRIGPAPPLVVVALGRAALTVPAVARSQRAMHRLVLEYVLIDPALPPVSDSWPDTRVTVVCDVDSEASLQARLRGWDVLRGEELDDWSPPHA